MFVVSNFFCSFQFLLVMESMFPVLGLWVFQQTYSCLQPYCSSIVTCISFADAKVAKRDWNNTAIPNHYFAVNNSIIHFLLYLLFAKINFKICKYITKNINLRKSRNIQWFWISKKQIKEIYLTKMIDISPIVSHWSPVNKYHTQTLSHILQNWIIKYS